MAITVGSLVEFSVLMLYANQRMFNVWGYLVENNPGPVTAAHLAEAWWNHVKGGYASIVPTSYGDLFQSIVIREMNNPQGEYAEYSIPASERSGTRNASGDLAPPFTALGVRLTVGTRLTRPGQKRFPCLTEGDSNLGVIAQPLRDAAEDFMSVMTTDAALGAPAATTVLRPVVFRKDSQGAVLVAQPITGAVVGMFVTTQNSRKYGRGS